MGGTMEGKSGGKASCDGRSESSFLSQVCNTVKLSAWTCFHLFFRSVPSELQMHRERRVHKFPLSSSECQGSMGLQ